MDYDGYRAQRKQRILESCIRNLNQMREEVHPDNYYNRIANLTKTEKDAALLRKWEEVDQGLSAAIQEAISIDDPLHRFWLDPQIAPSNLQLLAEIMPDTAKDITDRHEIGWLSRVAPLLKNGELPPKYYRMPWAERWFKHPTLPNLPGQLPQGAITQVILFYKRALQLYISPELYPEAKKAMEEILDLVSYDPKQYGPEVQKAANDTAAFLTREYLKTSLANQQARAR